MFSPLRLYLSQENSEEKTKIVNGLVWGNIEHGKIGDSVVSGVFYSPLHIVAKKWYIVGK